MSEEIMESMADYAEEIERSFRKIRQGDVITGTILSVSEDGIAVDLKYYAQGIVPASEISDDPTIVIDEKYKPGDEVTGSIIRTDDGQGNIVLSLKEANESQAYETLKEYAKEKKILTVKISSVVNGGVIAYAEGIRGFIPASQLALSYVENLDEWLHKTVDVMVNTVDAEKEKLVLSAKEVLKIQKEEETNSKKARLVPGSVLEGKVESIMPYGAFIQLPEGLSGLVHISRISQKRIKNPSEILKVGDTVKVKLIEVKDGKLSLSMKEFEDVTEVQADEVESFDYKEEGQATTTLGDLFKNLKF